MLDTPVDTWTGFDPGWGDAQVDFVVGMIESKMEDILQVMPDVYGEPDLAQQYELVDLKRMPASTPMPDELLIWRLKGHQWTQFDTYHFMLGFPEREFSRSLETRTYHEWWHQGVADRSWGLYRNGTPLTEFVYEEYGVDQSAPPESRPLRMNDSLRTADGQCLYYSHKDYGIPMGDAADDCYSVEHLVRDQIYREVEFFVGTFSLYETIGALFKAFPQELFESAAAFRKR